MLSMSRFFSLPWPSPNHGNTAEQSICNHGIILSIGLPFSLPLPPFHFTPHLPSLLICDTEKNLEMKGSAIGWDKHLKGYKYSSQRGGVQIIYTCNNVCVYMQYQGWVNAHKMTLKGIKLLKLALWSLLTNAYKYGIEYNDHKRIM